MRVRIVLGYAPDTHRLGGLEPGDQPDYMRRNARRYAAGLAELAVERRRDLGVAMGEVTIEYRNDQGAVFIFRPSAGRQAAANGDGLELAAQGSRIASRLLAREGILLRGATITVTGTR